MNERTTLPPRGASAARSPAWPEPAGAGGWKPQVRRKAPAARRPTGRETGLFGELRFKELTGLHLALGALILISIGRAHDHIGFLAVFRPGLTLTALCAVIALVKPRALRLDNLFSAWPAKAIMALAGAAVLSSFFGLSLGASGSFILENMLPVMVFFFLATTAMREPNDLRWMVVAFSVAVIVVVWASIFLSEAMHFDGYTRQGGAGMYDGNDIGVIYMVGLPLAMVLMRSKTRLLQILGAFTILGILASLVLTASRGGFLGLLVGGLAIIILSPGWSVIQKILIVAIPVFGLLVLAPDGYWDQMGTILNPQDDYNLTSDTGRVAIWTRGLGYVAQYPVFGLGPDNFVRAGWFISDTGRAGLVGASIRDQAPHNTFVQVWAELGSVGLGIWLAVLTYGTIAPLRLRKRMPRWWLSSGTSDQRFLYLLVSYLPASFIGFAATTFFVSHAYTPIFYALVAILAGATVVGWRTLKEGSGGLTPPHFQRLRPPESLR